MPGLMRYLTHPQVKIDPADPVPSWGLSELGGTCAETLANTGCLSGTTQIVSSGERKAIETAEIIAGKLKIAIEVREAMYRSGTGYLSPDEFEALANRFFAEPMVNVRGWERALDAQARIVREVGSSWLVIEPATCSSSAMVPSALFCSVTMPVLPSIEFTTSQPGAVHTLQGRESPAASMASNGRLGVRLWLNRIVYDGGTLTAAKSS
jgi:hypothetical protein